MSASLLNLASVPGAAGQPPVQGIAQQAAHAAQASGPLAGFEALLAAFFGDQGLTPPAGGLAGASTGGTPAALAQLAAQGQAQASANAKPAEDSDKTDDGTVATVALDATGLDAAALALAQPQTPVAPAPAEADDPAAEAAPDGAQAGKSAAPNVLAQLAAAAVAADARSAKALNMAAQLAGQPAAADAAGPDAGKPPAPTPANATPPPAAGLQAPALSDQTAALTAQTLPAPDQAVAAQAKPAEPLANTGKDKGQAIRTARVEGAPTGPAPVATSLAKAGEAALAAAADTSGKDAGASERGTDGPAPAEAKAQAPDANAPGGSFSTALNAQAASPQALAHAAALVRGSPQTVANLAAQIAKKLDGRSTRFDVQLDPAGLGKVDVRVEIDAAGKMTAALNFDNQQAASELKSRAGELQRALEQAGFDLSGGLSFDVAGQGGQAQGQEQDVAPAFRGRAFRAVLEGGAEAALTVANAYRPASEAGVDIRI